jgi:fructose-bisphosphate aldolase class II
MTSLVDLVPPGVVTGANLTKLLDHARSTGYAIPAVNVTSSSTANAVLEAARDNNAPVIIQISNGGGQFVIGKGIKTTADFNAEAVGSVALAMHVRAVASYYGIPVVLHSDHCAAKLLPWFDAMLEADEKFFDATGEPLFSSHMLDLSEETDEENIAICVKYFKKMTKMGIWLEMEIGITGGEEDGVNNENVDPEKLYTTPEQVWQVYSALAPIGNMFSIAAAFGNVHGVYKPGNVVLSPEKLGNHQAYTKKQLNSPLDKPIYLVMHGGSGSTKEEIAVAVKNGVIKMNIDTDTQWAYWDGVKNFVKEKEAYLQAQIGNPTGPEKPNKKYYDPRVWTRKAEESLIKRVGESMALLGSVNKYQRSKACGYDQVVIKKDSTSSVVMTVAVFAAGIALGAVIGSKKH